VGTHGRFWIILPETVAEFEHRSCDVRKTFRVRRVFPEHGDRRDVFESFCLKLWLSSSAGHPNVRETLRLVVHQPRVRHESSGSLRDGWGFRLAGPGSAQAPEAADGEDKGEQAEDAQRVKRPNEQEGWAGPGDGAVKEACWAHRVDDRHADRN